MTVLGFKKVNFKAQNGDQITGMSYWLSEPIMEYGEGVQVVKVFISSSRSLSFTPSVGDEVNVVYNRYGKVADFLGV